MSADIFLWLFFLAGPSMFVLIVSRRRAPRYPYVRVRLRGNIGGAHITHAYKVRRPRRVL